MNSTPVTGHLPHPRSPPTRRSLHIRSSRVTALIAYKFMGRIDTFQHHNGRTHPQMASSACNLLAAALHTLHISKKFGFWSR